MSFPLQTEAHLNHLHSRVLNYIIFFQDALLKRLGDGAHPFTMEVGQNAPPSVQLVPAKRYYGAPIGTSYDIRCYVADRSDEKLHRRSTVKMGIRLIHKTNLKLVLDAPENYTTVLNQKSTNGQTATTSFNDDGDGVGSSKQYKSDRIDSFTKLKLSPKAFRFTGKLCRSKSEIEKGPNERYDIISEVRNFFVCLLSSFSLK